MILFTLAFLSGVLYLQTWSQLPSVTTLMLTTLTGMLTWFSLRNKSRFALIPLAFLLGFLWSALYAQHILSWTLKKEWEGKPVHVMGYIASLPAKDRFGTRFEFLLKKISDENQTYSCNTKIRLMWPDANQEENQPLLHPGDQWQFMVKLKRIHSPQSPGAFDFEAWSLQKGLRATGAILGSEQNQFIQHVWYRYPLDQIRQLLQKRIQNNLPVTTTSSWLMALMLGERQGISAADWQVLRNTGTNHLMAIGGLHIGIVAAITHFCISALWRRFPRGLLWLPAAHVGAIAALISALFYSALSGFLLPTQRACFMLAMASVSVLSNKRVNAWNIWSLALLIVTLINPLTVLSESFWLSFGTIALIIYGMHYRLQPSGLWWQWGRVQWVIGLGLIPLTLLLFQQIALISFIANSVAIPWLAFLILPFCLLGEGCLFFSPVLSHFFLWMADKSLNILWMLLTWLSHAPYAVLHFSLLNSGIFIVMMCGFILLLMPNGSPGRWLGIFWIMPALTLHPLKPEYGQFKFAMLDVGQGLAVVVQTRHHVLVYDTGSHILNSDMGEAIVLPYLHTNAIRQIDTLVISHGDNDHFGGAQAILQTMQVQSIFTSVPEKMKTDKTQFCQSGMAWQWDGVYFSFLYPDKNNLNLGNDSSCVLKINNGEHQILLTGDIEKFAEKQLLSHDFSQLKTDILIAPHHGSKTSGLNDFIEMTHPGYVLYATGYRNRYHFPHPSVVAAYQEVNAQAYNSVDSGTIEFNIKKDGAVKPPRLYRIARQKYWYDR